jgi:hypothetical protein
MTVVAPPADPTSRKQRACGRLTSVLAAIHLDHNSAIIHLRTREASVILAISFTSGRIIRHGAALRTRRAASSAICSSVLALAEPRPRPARFRAPVEEC